MTAAETVIVLAKEPIPGRVKTRLCPPLTHDDAAALAAAALSDTLEAILAVRCTRRILALDGNAGSWVPAEFEVRPQPAGGLAERLTAAFADVEGPGALVGMDTPQVPPPLIEHALDSVRAEGTAALGPSTDGGFWLVAFARAPSRAFNGIPMSSPATGIAQRRRLDELGLRTTVLPTLRDVDDYSDACAVARAAPTSRFATMLARVAPDRARAGL